MFTHYLPVNRMHHSSAFLPHAGEAEELFKRYGKTQLVVAMEELAELQQAVSKVYRHYDTKVPEDVVDNLIEEMVDVQIMLEQLAWLLSSKAELDPVEVATSIKFKYKDKWGKIKKNLLEAKK